MAAGGAARVEVLWYDLWQEKWENRGAVLRTSVGRVKETCLESPWGFIARAAIRLSSVSLAAVLVRAGLFLLRLLSATCLALRKGGFED